MKLDSHDRRRFVMFLLGGLAAKQAAHAKNTVKIAEFSPSGQRKNVIEVDKIRKPDAEWKAQLTPEQFEVTRCKRPIKPNIHTYVSAAERRSSIPRRSSNPGLAGRVSGPRLRRKTCR